MQHNAGSIDEGAEAGLGQGVSLIVNIFDYFVENRGRFTLSDNCAAKVEVFTN